MIRSAVIYSLLLCFYGGVCGSLQYQLNKLQQVMENFNGSETDSFFLEAPPAECPSSSPQIVEENLVSVGLGVRLNKGLQNRKKKRFNKSLWTLQENLKYIQFLQQNREMFCSTKENRRLLKINKMISQFIGTRSPDQCRSHHQKMVKYHGGIDGIITHVCLLHNLYVDHPHRATEKEPKIPMRIRKKVSKADHQEATPQPDCEKALWDVLCIDAEPLSSVGENLLYL